MKTKRAFPKVIAEVGEKGIVRANGREGEALLMLAKQGTVGVHAFDSPGGPAYRLAAYMHSLRRMGIPIRTAREMHDGGWHARYICQTAIQILSKQDT